MHWLYLLIAGFCEIIWVVGLKYSEGFSKFTPSIFTVAAMIASALLLSLAVKILPIGTAYVIWTGIGAIGAVVAGIILFNEPHNLLKLLFILLIIVGIAGLRLTSAN